MISGGLAPLPLEHLPVHLDELGVVDRRPEAFFNSLKIDLVAVARKLGTVRQAPGEVADVAASRPPSAKPGVGRDLENPCPDIKNPAGAGLRWWRSLAPNRRVIDRAVGDRVARIRR